MSYSVCQKVLPHVYRNLFFKDNVLLTLYKLQIDTIELVIKNQINVYKKYFRL